MLRGVPLFSASPGMPGQQGIEKSNIHRLGLRVWIVGLMAFGPKVFRGVFMFLAFPLSPRHRLICMWAVASVI